MRAEASLKMIAVEDPSDDTDTEFENDSCNKSKVTQFVKTAVRKACTVENAKKKFPISLWLPKYRKGWFLGDLVAGLTVGLTVIPQGLAYAQVAELPPQYGLYSAFMGCFVYCFLGTAKDITLGPTAIMSLMIAEFGHSPVPHDATYAVILSLISGLLQLVLGIFHLGFLINFISFPVISGFTSAAAIVIGFSQVKKILGLTGIPRKFLDQVYVTFKKIPDTNVWDLTMGLICILILILMKLLKDITDKKAKKDKHPTKLKKVTRKLVWLICTSRNAIVVIVASGVAAALLANGVDVLTLTSEITPGLPEFRLPQFTINTTNITRTTAQVFSDLGGGIGIIPLISFLETIAIGSAFAPMNNYRIDASQELIALGTANVVGAFCSSYPVAGSFSRTAVNCQSGVKTPAGGIWTGGLVILALLLLTPYFVFIPDAALAAVIIAAVIHMIDVKILVELWRVKKIDLIPLIVTFVLSLTLNVEYGILAGTGVSLLFLMYPTARPKLTLSQDGVILVSPNQGLRYPGIGYIKQKIMDRAITEDGKKLPCVIDCTNITALDYTSAQGLSQLFDNFKRLDVKLALANPSPAVLGVLRKMRIKNLRHSKTVHDAIRMVGGDHETPNGFTTTIEIDSSDGELDNNGVAINGHVVANESFTHL